MKASSSRWELGRNRVGYHHAEGTTGGNRSQTTVVAQHKIVGVHNFNEHNRVRLICWCHRYIIVKRFSTNWTKNRLVQRQLMMDQPIRQMDYHRYYDKICIEYHEKSENIANFRNNSVRPSERNSVLAECFVNTDLKGHEKS